MNENYYLQVKLWVKGGQYTMEEVLLELDTAKGKQLLTFEQYEELKVLAEQYIDMSYTGNTHPTNHDLKQDLIMASIDMSVIELFELMLSTMDQKVYTQRNVSVTRSISDSYVRIIIAGNRTFSSVPLIMKPEVAQKLLDQKRCDLIDVSEYHKTHTDCPYGNVPDEPLIPIEPQI